MKKIRSNKFREIETVDVSFPTQKWKRLNILIMKR